MVMHHCWLVINEVYTIDKLLLNCLITFIYPLVNVYIAIENGPVEIVSFPIKKGDFP